MLNADTGNTYVVPIYGSTSPEQNPSAYDIEQAVVPKHVRESTIDLGHEEVPRENYWGVPEQNHEATPQPVVMETNERKAPDAAEQIDAMTPEQSARYVQTLSYTLAGVRQEALTLAA